MLMRGDHQVDAPLRQLLEEMLAHRSGADAAVRIGHAERPAIDQDMRPPLTILEGQEKQSPRPMRYILTATEAPPLRDDAAAALKVSDMAMAAYALCR